jgi:hypothetical protein
VDIDVLEDVDAGPLILEERDDSVSVRDLNGQRTPAGSPSSSVLRAP